MVEKRIANSDGRTEGLKWQCSNIFLHKLKLLIFQDHLNKKNPVAQWRIEFSITSLEPGGNSEPSGNVQIYFYIT